MPCCLVRVLTVTAASCVIEGLCAQAPPHGVPCEAALAPAVSEPGLESPQPVSQDADAGGINTTVKLTGLEVPELLTVLAETGGRSWPATTVELISAHCLCPKCSRGTQASWRLLYTWQHLGTTAQWAAIGRAPGCSQARRHLELLPACPLLRWDRPLRLTGEAPNRSFAAPSTQTPHGHICGKASSSAVLCLSWLHVARHAEEVQGYVLLTGKGARAALASRRNRPCPYVPTGALACQSQLATMLRRQRLEAPEEAAALSDHQG